ncbi:DUF4167 domain-containing protein [Magnetovibrio sp.]|uniref:DUF4167 domain-containing protein n=1 Tax=Magnetovibrio sp. TaxID=2024836 RepID=UPI002F9474B9
MKQAPNQRRSRGRGNNPNNNGGGRRNSRNQTYESNGPDIKVRGSAQQVLDKYLQLARDCQSGGDRVKAEAYLQFAEHYYRIVNADQDGDQGRSDRQQSSERQQQNQQQQQPSERPQQVDAQAAEVQPSFDAQSPMDDGYVQLSDAEGDQPSEQANERPAKERPPRGRGRGRSQNANTTNVGSTMSPLGGAKNEATLAAEAAAANEAALKAAQVKKPARKPVKKTVDAEVVELTDDAKSKAATA